MDLAERLRSTRTRLGLTQADLARQAGTSIGTVRDLEQGRTRRPRARSLRAIGAVLGLELTAEADPPPEAAAPPKTGTVAVSLLGPLTVSLDGDPVAIGTGRHTTVLARLALTPGRPAGRDELITLLWGDDPPPGAANVVQTHVSRLRRLFTIAWTPGGYALHTDAGGLDLIAYRERLSRASAPDLPPQRAFDLLAGALDMWHGDRPAGNVPELATDPLVTALVDERVETAIRLARLAGKVRRERRVLPLLRRLVREHPWQEALHARLVVALAASGQQAAAIDAYESIRRRLAEELGVDPSAELAEARQTMLSRREHREPVVAGAPAPRTPAPPRDFLGRSAELWRVERALRHPPGGPGPAICVVSGMAGVGKTSLALTAARELRREFPDGQLYIDLRGADDRPIGAVPALARLLCALGEPERAIPGDPGEAAARYRGLLAQRRVLVLLDNASHAELVRPLLPGPGGSAALVTSRNRCAGLGGATTVELPVLSPADALQMIAAGAGEDRVHAERAQAEALADLCGRLPMALRVVARRLARHPRWTLAGLRDRLVAEQRQAGTGEAAVHAGFELSYRELAPLQAAAFRAAAHVPGETVSAAAVAAVLGAGEPEVTRAMDALVEENLLQSGGARRYSFHDLLRGYAARRAGHFDEARLYAWYLGRTVAAMRLVYADMVRLEVETGLEEHEFPDVDAATEWLNEELGTLLAVVETAAGGAHRARSWQLADQLRGYFFLRGDVVDWLITGRTGLAAAEAAGDRRAQAAMHQTIGQAHWAAGKHHLAAESYQRGIEAAHEAGWAVGEAYLSHNLGLVRAELGATGEAERLYRRVLGLGTGPELDHVRAVTLNDLGTMCHERGQLVEAAEHLSAALRMNEHAARHASVMTNRGNLGMVLRQLERFDEARTHLDTVLADHRRTGSVRAVMSTLDELSQLYHRLEEWVAAVGTATEAVRLAREHGPWAQAGTLNTLGFALTGSRAFGEARKQFGEALRIGREHGYPYFEAQAWLGLAELGLVAGDADEAWHAAGTAAGIAGRSAFRALHGSALMAQARAALDRGDDATAADRCAAAGDVLRQVNAPGPLRDHRTLRARIDALGPGLSLPGDRRP